MMTDRLKPNNKTKRDAADGAMEVDQPPARTAGLAISLVPP